jgi:hypothetical protein
VTGKGKVIPLLNDEQRREEVLEKWRYSFTLWPFYHRVKSLRYPLNRSLLGCRSVVDEMSKRRNHIIAPAEN